MNEAQVYQEQIDTLVTALKTEIDGTDSSHLYARSGPSVNTPGFLYWHTLRIWDWDVNALIGGKGPDQDAWHAGGFSEKSGYNPDGKGHERLPGTGLAYSDAEVDEVGAIPLEVLNEYRDQLVADTNAYLASGADLRTEIHLGDRPSTTPAARLQHLIGHSYSHLGDIRFSKGLLGQTDATYPGK